MLRRERASKRSRGIVYSYFGCGDSRVLIWWEPRHGILSHRRDRMASPPRRLQQPILSHRTHARQTVCERCRLCRRAPASAKARDEAASAEAKLKE